MSDERQNNGRRSTDSWLARVGALAVILSMIYAVAAWGIPLAGLPRRVDALEAIQPAQLFMSCVNFRDSHPAQLPAVCDQAISRGPR
jgi:hypothetical protein